jgi:hypothetical protein
VEWIQLAQDKCRRRNLVNTVMNLRGSGATELVHKIPPFDHMLSQITQVQATFLKVVLMLPIHLLYGFSLETCSCRWGETVYEMRPRTDVLSFMKVYQFVQSY